MTDGYKLAMEVLKEEAAKLKREGLLLDTSYKYEPPVEFEDLEEGDKPWRWEYQHEECSNTCTRFKRRLYDRE